MAQKKISDLTSAAALTGAELVPVVQGGATVSTTTNLIAALAGAGSFEPLYRTLHRETGDYVLVIGDASQGVEMNVGSANTVTVPANSSVAFPVGTLIPVVQYGSGLTSIVAGGGVTIHTSAGNLDSPGQYAPMFLKKIATDEWYLWNGTAGGGGGTQDLQDVLDEGSSATIATNLVILAVDINIQSSTTQQTRLSNEDGGLINITEDVDIEGTDINLSPSGDVISTAPITLPGNPVNNLHAATKQYVDALVAGLLDLKGDTDTSANPNYPSALKGDAYYVTVAGKIGGASGKSVDVGDLYVAKADNAGGTEASVGTSWFVLEHNLAGVALLASPAFTGTPTAPTASAGTSTTQIATTAFVDAALTDVDYAIILGFRNLFNY